MLVALHARVDDHQLARFDDLVVDMVVQGFAVLGEDGGEGDAPALGEGHAFHLAHDVLLDNPEADAVTGDGMHLEAQVARGVDGGDLHGFLD